MTQRRDFLKMLGMSAVASVLPKVEIPEVKPEKLTISSIGNFGIGVGSVERMRITSNGRVTLSDVSPSANIKIFENK
jgi:hypothetical protein